MKTKYYELTIKIQQEYIDLVVNFITEKVKDAIEIGGDFIIIRSSDNLKDIEDSIKQYILSLQDYFKQKIGYNMSVETKNNIDWIKKFQKSVSPLSIGKFYIRSNWHAKNGNLIDIIIDPSFAFGTGHHFTTSSVILAICKYINRDSLVLDVGCGSGVLSICANKLGAIVDICDTDKLAIKNSIFNFKANNCNINRYWIGSIDKTSNKYNVILANITSDIIFAISKELILRLKPQGILIVSGILKKYKDKILKRFISIKLIEKQEDDHWVTFVFRKTDE